MNKDRLFWVVATILIVGLVLVLDFNKVFNRSTLQDDLDGVEKIEGFDTVLDDHVDSNIPYFIE